MFGAQAAQEMQLLTFRFVTPVWQGGPSPPATSLSPLHATVVTGGPVHIAEGIPSLAAFAESSAKVAESRRQLQWWQINADPAESVQSSPEDR